MRLQAYNDNGTMKFRQVSGSQALDSLPVGTTIGTVRTGGVIPNGYLEADGSTFDTSKYPELYSILGTNTLPELFDHSKPSDYETFTGNTASAQYDGEISAVGTTGDTAQVSLRITINGETVMLGGNQFVGCGAISFKKGDTISYSSLRTTPKFYVRYYKQHLLIKAATIGISDVSINTVKTALTPSKIENLGTMSGHTSLANAIEMPYSGLLAYNWSTANSSATSHTLHIVYDDGTEDTIGLASIAYAGEAVTFAVQKGWKIYCSNNEPARAVARIQKLFI